MADGPKDYRDPKVTTSGGNESSMKWLWYILGAIVVLLLLAWIFGWFGGEVETGTVTTTEPIAEEPVADDVIVVPE